MLLTLLGLQSRFGDKPVKFGVICPQNGTAVLKGLTNVTTTTTGKKRPPTRHLHEAGYIQPTGPT